MLQAARAPRRPAGAGARRPTRAPSLYDEALRLLARRGLPVPASHTERDWTQPYAASDAVEAAWLAVYRDPKQHWDLYQLGEELTDLEDAFRLWRFRHVTTVERVIGFKRGTGGTSGVGYLRKMLDVVLFPEIWTPAHGAVSTQRRAGRDEHAACPAWRVFAVRPHAALRAARRCCCSALAYCVARPDAAQARGAGHRRRTRRLQRVRQALRRMRCAGTASRSSCASTQGAAENLALLRDPDSGVDLAFVQGGADVERRNDEAEPTPA